MATKAQPVKNTAGEGFAVEDFAIASIAAHLLTDVPWAGANGGIVREIQCQTQQDGWLFDDAVVSVEKDGAKWQCGCSIKSYTVFGPNGHAQAEFAKLLWQQAEVKDGNPFRAGKNSLVIIAAQNEPKVREAWFGLTESARLIDPSLYAKRFVEELEPSPIRKVAFKSLQQAGPTTTSAEDAVQLLQSLHICEQDFQHTSSQSASQAIALCQNALTDDVKDQAPDLWGALVRCVARYRRKGGTLNLMVLLAELAHRFSLRHHPSFSADWEQLISESNVRMDYLPTYIGGVASVKRATLLKSIDDYTGRNQICALVGESGNGKSVLARRWARNGSGIAIWLRATELGKPGGVRATFNLRHALPELLSHVSTPVKLVLDGLDKCFEESGFDEVTQILLAVSEAPVRDRWQTVITCCPEDWERVRRKLLQRTFVLSGNNIRIERFTKEELFEACERLPFLANLARRPHLIPLLCWPKILDLVATYGSQDTPLEHLSTESNFARWFWKAAITQDTPVSDRDRVARKLAVQLADSTLSTLSLSRFESSEQTSLAALARDGHLEIDEVRQTVRFAHDLLADWARLRELQVQRGDVSNFLQQRLHSPLWHRAVRYYGLDLLEQNNTAENWHALFKQFPGQGTVDALTQNLLLEAPVFAADQTAILERLWPLLEADKGMLLKRFLRQFLHVATLPDDQVLQQASEEKPDFLLELATLYRVPWAPYWIGVLRLISSHTERVIEVASDELADICKMWLPYHRAFSREMNSVAAMAVHAARRFYRSERRTRHISRHETSTEEKICQTLLLAAPILPEEVSELVLKLSGRRAPTAEEEIPEQPYMRSRIMPDPGPAKPWPEGPQWKPSPAFVSALMEGQYAAALCGALPEIAAEALFGALLNIPRENDYIHDFGHNIDECGFASRSEVFSSSFWTNGPFVAFLNRSPEVAIRMIVRLVNFATDRGAELPEDLRERLSVEVKVGDFTREWRGTQWSFVWHKGHVFGPRSVCCALLSLEFWFYQLLETDKPLDSYIDIILNESRSIALGAVLICIGKKQPDLFLGPLCPLVSAVDFQWFERRLALRGEDSYRAANFNNFGAERNLLVDWVSMPHRKETLFDLILRLYLSQPAWRQMMDKILPFWQARLDRGDPDDPGLELLPMTIARFDLKNWGLEKTEGNVLLNYTPPDHLPQATPDEQLRMERTELLLFLPMECNRILMGEIPSSEAKIEDWWSKLDRISELPIDDDDQGLRNREDAQLAIVSVALVHHREWLATLPEREKQAKELLLNVGTRPPRRFWFTEDDICDYKWDNFAAWGTATLWCEQPDDAVLRQAVGALVMWDRYLVVERVMLITGEKRAQLGLHFDELLAHAVRYAQLRRLIQWARHRREPMADAQKRVAAHLKTFLKRKTKLLPEDWSSLDQPIPLTLRATIGAWFARARGFITRRTSTRRYAPRGLDIQQLVVALSWAKDLKKANDDEERQQWLHFHLESLHCAITRIASLGDDDDIDDYGSMQDRWPYKDEERLLERAAKIVAALPADSSHRKLWEPIYSLGARAEHWIDRFNSAWFIASAGGDNIQEAFADQWAELLEFATTSSTWNPDTGRQRAHGEMIKELLGMRGLGASFWRAELQGAVEHVRKHHETWARKRITNPWNAKEYLYFLSYPAATGLRISGLMMLNELVPMDNQYFWRDDKITRAISHFLQTLLSSNFTELAADSKSRRAFLAFATKLAALQDPLGIELLTMAGNRFANLDN